MKRRRLIILLLFVVLLPLFVFAFGLGFERFRGQRAIACYKKQLIARGESLDFAARREPRVPDEDDGLPEVLRLFSQLPKNSQVRDHYPTKMEMISPALARASFMTTQWVSPVVVGPKVTNDWSMMEMELKANEATLAALRIALQKRGFNPTNNYSQVSGSGFGPLTQMKSLAIIFSTAACDALHHGENQKAVDNIVALLNTMRTIDKHGVAITELVREAISSIGFSTTWEALQANGWSDVQLVHLQQEWEKVSHITNMVMAVQGERAFGYYNYEIYSKSNTRTFESLSLGGDPEEGERLSEILLKNEFFRKQLLSRIWRFSFLDQDRLRYFQGLDYLMRKTTSYKSVPDLELMSILCLEDGSRPKLYNRLRFAMCQESLPALSRLPIRAVQTETQRSMALCALALKRHELRYQKAPRDLASLVPEFLPAVPLDWFDGKPMKYKWKSDGSWVLYSIGENGADDEGDASPTDIKTKYQAIWDGKDAVWPTAERKAD